MSWLLAEHLVNSLKTVIETDLPTKLTALLAEYNDDVVLPEPKVYYIGEQDLDRSFVDPSCFILVDQATFPNFRSSLTVEFTCSVRIGIVCGHVDSSALRRSVYRYARALFEVITDAKRAGTLNGWQPVGPGTISYSAILAKNSSFLGDTTLSWDFQKVEDR